MKIKKILPSLKQLNKRFTFKPFTTRNKWVDTSNSNNHLYTPKDELNYEVYDLKLNEYYVPSIKLPEFHDEGLVIFKYDSPTPDETGFIKLPQVPYEIKEHAMKGFLYTFFLTFAGRVFSNFSNMTTFSFFPLIPASVFLYQYSSALSYMINSVTEIRLNPDGHRITLLFKYRKPMTISVSQIIKKKEENFLNQCFTEPMLYPIQINRTEEFGKYSLWSHMNVYLYSESHQSIKYGEILRAIINNQPIELVKKA